MPALDGDESEIESRNRDLKIEPGVKKQKNTPLIALLKQNFLLPVEKALEKCGMENYGWQCQGDMVLRMRTVTATTLKSRSVHHALSFFWASCALLSHLRHLSKAPFPREISTSLVH